MINSVTLLGSLGRDPEIRNTQSGKQVCNLSVATSESRKDQSGEWQNKTTWHNVVVWGDSLVQMLERRAQKGTKVFVQGKIDHRTWDDKDGNKRTTTEIVVAGFGGQIKLIDGKKDDQGQAQNSQPTRQNMDTPPIDLDDEIPF